MEKESKNVSSNFAQDHRHPSSLKQKGKLFNFFQRLRKKETAVFDQPAHNNENDENLSECHSVDRVTSEAFQLESQNTEESRSEDRDPYLLDHLFEASSSISLGEYDDGEVKDDTISVVSVVSACVDSKRHSDQIDHEFVFDETHNSKSHGIGPPGKCLKYNLRRHKPTLSTMTADVVLLNGEVLKISVGRNARGRCLIELVQLHVRIEEMFFFGLAWISSRKKTKSWFWLREKRRVISQLKDEKWSFYLQVKFYPPTTALVRGIVSKYQICLQIRQDIYAGKLPCSRPTLVFLSSLMVQSEVGDFDEIPEDNTTSYLKACDFVPHQTEKLLELVKKSHQLHKGMSSEEASLKYLETAQGMEQYGMEIAEAMDDDGCPIGIGVGFPGVKIFRQAVCVTRFAWPKVARICYRRRRFILIVNHRMRKNALLEVSFRLATSRLAKQLWRRAVEQHCFFRLRSTLPPLRGSRPHLPDRTLFECARPGVSQARASSAPNLSVLHDIKARFLANSGTRAGPTKISMSRNASRHSEESLGETGNAEPFHLRKTRSETHFVSPQTPGMTRDETEQDAHSDEEFQEVKGNHYHRRGQIHFALVQEAEEIYV